MRNFLRRATAVRLALYPVCRLAVFADEEHERTPTGVAHSDCATL